MLIKSTPRQKIEEELSIEDIETIVIQFLNETADYTVDREELYTSVEEVPDDEISPIGYEMVIWTENYIHTKMYDDSATGDPTWFKKFPRRPKDWNQ